MAKDGTALASDMSQMISTMCALLPGPVAVRDRDGRVVISNCTFSEIFQNPACFHALPVSEMKVAGHGIFDVQVLPLNDQGFKIVYATEVSEKVRLRQRLLEVEAACADLAELDELEDGDAAECGRSEEHTSEL